MPGLGHADASLVADIGGTNARLALVDEGRTLSRVRTFACRAYASLEAVVSDYSRTCGRRVGNAVLAVAGPVADGAVAITNLGWRTNETRLAAACGFDRVRLCNDYEALAYAAPQLEAGDLHCLGGPGSLDKGTLLVLGPGTGFGAAALVRDGAYSAALIGEAGHMALAPTDDIESEILRRLGRRYGRVSVERVLSGRGLVDLHATLCSMAEVEAHTTDPAEITAAAAQGDPVACATVERFCAILGSVAGDLALGFGARGGVQIGGGIAPRLSSTLAAGAFRARFEAKGRFESYMREVPTHLVVHPYATLIGAANLLQDARAS